MSLLAKQEKRGQHSYYPPISYIHVQGNNTNSKSVERGAIPLGCAIL